MWNAGAAGTTAAPGAAQRHPAGNTNETALLNVDGNRLLAAVRTSQARDVELFESDDAGGTWSEQGSVTSKINTPPTCCRWQTGAS